MDLAPIGLSTRPSTPCTKIPSIKELTLHKGKEDPNQFLWNRRRNCVEDVINLLGQRVVFNPDLPVQGLTIHCNFAKLEVDDPYRQLCEMALDQINKMPLGFVEWRMVDRKRKEDIVLQEINIQNAIDRLEKWTEKVRTGFKAVEMPIPDKTSHKPFLNEMQKKYSGKGQNVISTEHETSRIIQEIQSRINYKEKLTGVPSYQILEYSHDVSVAYLQKNRLDYANNTLFFTKQKVFLEKRLNALVNAHRVFKEELYKLGKGIEGDSFVLVKVPSIISICEQPRFPQVFLIGMSEENIRKVEAIFLRLLKTRERMVEEHVSNENPIPSINDNPVGFALRAVEDWTPCLNVLVENEIEDFKRQQEDLKEKIKVLKGLLDQYTENLHEAIQSVNTKQPNEQPVIDQISHRAKDQREIVENYDTLIKAIDMRMAKIQVKAGGASEETYVAIGRSHDLSSNQIKKNVNQFLDVKQLDVIKLDAKLDYEALIASFATFTDLIKKYQGMKGTSSASWSRWFQEMNYSYWYPKKEPEKQINLVQPVEDSWFSSWWKGGTNGSDQ